MNKTFTLGSGLLAMSLLAASGFAAAADAALDSAPQARHARHRHFDPVSHAQRNLDKLAQKLNLKDEQKTAWQIYADGAMSRAQEKTARMDEHRSHKGEARVDADTATKLDKMVLAMRYRADQMQKIAQDTRAFEGVLSPEQKTIFDLYWKAQWHQRMGHRPLA